jgi:hypothetical protein
VILTEIVVRNIPLANPSIAFAAVNAIVFGATHANSHPRKNIEFATIQVFRRPL